MAATTGNVRTGGASTGGGVESEWSGSPPREDDQGLLDLVRGRAINELNARKDEVSRTIETVARTMRRAGEPLRDLPYEAPARYADGAASGLERFAAGLRERDVSELPEEVRGLARRQPAAFLAAGFAVGVFAARFLKSSAVEEGPGTHAAPVGGGGRARTAGSGATAGARRGSPRPGAGERGSGDT